MIPKVAITLDSVDRGTSRQTETDGAGRYVMLQVQPGIYRLTAKAAGFADVVANGVVLAVNQPATLDLKFERVGAIAETISISAESVQLNTTDGSIGNAIGTKPILQLPLFGRNLAGLLAFQPGVTGFAEVGSIRPGAIGDDRSGSVNGGKSDQANVTLDGVDVNQQATRTAFTSVLRVTLDSTQEFRTTTTGATADQGRSSGAQVALVTKSGTNNFHGSVYHVHRNTITAANSFFNNASGVKRPPLLINIPGGSLGGPILKNKAFFFLNFETRRDASSANVSRTVPSNELRQGIVRYLNTAGGTSQVGPADIQTRIDPSGIGVNQAVLNLLRQYPAPNDFALGDGLNIVGYRFTAPLASKQDTYVSRFDYTLDAKHSFFWRGQLQNDRASGAPQFPGQPPAQVQLVNAKGYVIGHTALVKPNLVSTFRYGLTRQSYEDTGVQNTSIVTFRNLDSFVPLTRGLSRQIPVHNITQDFAWTKGKHDVRIGGNLRWIENRSRNFNNAFNAAITNLSWLRGTGSDLQGGVPDLAPAGRVAYGDAMVIALGLITQGTGRYNYNIDGSVIPTGAPVSRRFQNEEYEWYVQDSWKIRQNLTMTLGVRHTLAPPIYEANGVQISSDIPIGDWFNRRGGLADQGSSQEQAGRISYVLANAANGRPLYPFRKANFAPRAAIAWSPSTSSDGLLGFLTGGAGKTSVRAGWGLYYDVIGQPLTATFDANAFGLATSLTNPAGQLTSAQAPRFTSLTDLPSSLIRPAPRGGFPTTPPSAGAGSFAITNSIDDNLQIPYVMRMNFSVGRELRGGWFVEGSYVGSMSRKSLINRDLAMPTNLRDPRSGQSYFEAATAMARFVGAQPSGAANQTAYAATLAPIPFFENFYSNFAGNGRTATQNVYLNAARFYPNDFTSTLADIDHFCDPACSRLGPNLMLNPQFSALSAWSSIGGGNYHAMQWVVRKRMQSLTMDFNYTWSKSIDLASRAENAGSFSGFLPNSWEPDQRKGVSDYDQRHIVNSYAIWELPFGKGRRFLSGSGAVVNAILGGWQLAPTFQYSTSLPTSVGNGRNWPTNWNITGTATPTGPQPATRINPQMRGIDGRVAAGLYADGQTGRNAWTFTLPGQSGSRNTVRVDGVFSINLGIGKRFNLPFEGHTLQFRAESFNLTNTNRFNGVNLDLGNAGAFGRFTSSLSSPRQIQFLARYEF